MTRTRPLRRMILHFSHIGLTEGRTFTLASLATDRWLNIPPARLWRPVRSPLPRRGTPRSAPDALRTHRAILARVWLRASPDRGQLSRGLHAGSTPARDASHMSVVILSPHLDDSVLSCWHLLTQPGEVEVINVFAGVPTGLDGPAWWDEYSGATDSAARMRERLQEDRRALEVAGRSAVNLGFLDEQYRSEEQPLTPITGQIERLLEPGARIFAPAAFADHADHALVRSAALQLRTAGFEVSLYADLPHATIRGWPAWVSGKNGPPSKDLASELWDHVLASTDAGAPAVHHLDAAAHAQKLVAVRMYGTQLQALEEFVDRPLSDPGVFGHEVIWPTASPVPAVHPVGHPH